MDEQVVTALGGDIQTLARAVETASGPHSELVCAIKAQTAALHALTQMIRNKF